MTNNENQMELKKDMISWTKTAEQELLSKRTMLNMAYYNRLENQLKWRYNQFFK